MADAAVLAGIPMDHYYRAEDDASRLAAVAAFLKHRNAVAEAGATSNAVLHQALRDFPPLAKLVNETMKKALPVSELGALVFPDAEAEIADRAVLHAHLARQRCRLKSDEAGLLPCRVHAFLRGLPGLWACLDPDCTVNRNGIPSGPIGAMYGQPRNTCDCGARVLELFTCRQCGTAYTRAYTDDIENPSFLWQEPGKAFNTASGPITELQPIDLLLEEPSEDVDIVGIVETHKRKRNGRLLEGIELLPRRTVKHRGMTLGELMSMPPCGGARSCCWWTNSRTRTRRIPPR